MRFRTVKNRGAPYSIGARLNGTATAVLRDAKIAPQSTRKHGPARRFWSDNCNELSRAAPTGGNVKVLSKEKCQVIAERNGWSLERAKGYVDGEICRSRSKKPSKYALIGIDEYSLGFRAGYFDRLNGTPAESASRTAEPAS
jgi:hypothetical protein